MYVFEYKNNLGEENDSVMAKKNNKVCTNQIN